MKEGGERGGGSERGVIADGTTIIFNLPSLVMLFPIAKQELSTC